MCQSSLFKKTGGMLVNGPLGTMPHVKRSRDCIRDNHSPYKSNLKLKQCSADCLSPGYLRVDSAKRARKEARDAGEASARPAGCTLPMPCAVLGRHAAAGAHGAWPQPVAGGGVMALQPLASGLRVGREAAKDCVHEVAIPDG